MFSQSKNLFQCAHCARVLGGGERQRSAAAPRPHSRLVAWVVFLICLEILVRPVTLYTKTECLFTQIVVYRHV